MCVRACACVCACACACVCVTDIVSKSHIIVCICVCLRENILVCSIRICVRSYEETKIQAEMSGVKTLQRHTFYTLKTAATCPKTLK